MTDKTTVAAFSGGKDSTAMVLKMAADGEDFVCIHTATGNEMPEVADHIARVIAHIGRPLIDLKAPSLESLMEHWGALPNWRQRWCTRMIKIAPCVAYLKTIDNPTLCVGLRADEPERGGLYDDCASYRYPLREAGMGLAEVRQYCRENGVEVPERTDCAWCYGQRLYEWYNLWRDYPELFAQGEAWEDRVGHTFRSAGRDSWPAPLKELRERFELGQEPRAATKRRQLLLLADEGLEENEGACRVCRM